MIKKLIKKIIILGVLVAGISFLWYQYQLNRTYQVPSTTLIVEEGLGVKQISAAMEATGYIHSDYWFRTYAWQRGLEEEFIAGTYELPEELSMRELLEILTSHQTVQHSERITLIEGWTAAEMAEYLESTTDIAQDDFFELVGYPLQSEKNQDGKTGAHDYSDEYDFLVTKPTDVGLEGYLFPDTYLIEQDATADAVVRRLLDNFDDKVSAQMRADIEARGLTLHDVVIIASILERELLTLEDKKNGSSVIYNRLDIGMALQMDSTVNFITGGNRPSVTYKDLEAESQYNTYKYPGLPPGPISNPGLDSLVAAIYPNDTNYLFFLTDPEGVAYFATSAEGHNNNRALYLR